MIIPLDKAVKFYELMMKPETEALLKRIIPLLCPTHNKTSDEVFDLLQRIRAIDATPDKVVAIGEEGE